MIRHIVLFKMKEGMEQEAVRLAKDLLALKASTGGLMTDGETALDIVRGVNSYDVVLNSVFKSREDLEKYRVHPEHVKVVEYINGVCSSRFSVDYPL